MYSLLCHCNLQEQMNRAVCKRSGNNQQCNRQALADDKGSQRRRASDIFTCSKVRRRKIAPVPRISPDRLRSVRRSCLHEVNERTRLDLLRVEEASDPQPETQL